LGIQGSSPILISRKLSLVREKKWMIEPDGCLGCMWRRHPMNGGFRLALLLYESASGLNVIGAMQFSDRTGLRVLGRAYTLDDVPIAQADLAARRQAVELFGWVLAEIVLLDVERP